MTTGMAAAPGGTARRSRVSGVDRAFQVMDYLMKSDRPATAYDIAKGIGAPPSTLYEVVDALVGKDVLTRSADGLVWLGPRLYHYGLAYGRKLDLMTVAAREMEALSRLVGETVQICGRDDDMMVVLAMAEAQGHFHVSSRVGTRVPLNWTASGRLLTGHLPRAERLALYRRAARPSPTGRAETSPEKLCDAAEQALADRISIQMSESDFAVSCIAAPICDPEGHCVATVSIVLPEPRANERRLTFIAAVQEAALRVERALGWRTDL